METVTDSMLLGSKITALVIAAMKLKRHLLLKKSYDKLRQCIKSRHITLATKVYIVKVMIFPVVMYRCESWTIKKAEG